MSDEKPVDVQQVEEQVNFQDLNEEDKKRVTELPFKEFKGLFIWNTMKLADAIVLVMAVRQFVENTHSQNHITIKDGHKKHAWLSQKIFDLLKINSIYTIKLASEQKLKELQAAEGERKVGMSPELAHPYGETPMEQQGIQDNTNGERRFHVVPGSEV